jgi:hypothetical protein
MKLRTSFPQIVPVLPLIDLFEIEAKLISIFSKAIPRDVT